MRIKVAAAIALAVACAVCVSCDGPSREASDAASGPPGPQAEYERHAEYADYREWHAIAGFLREFGERDGRPMRRYMQNGGQSVVFHTDDAEVTVSQVTDDRLVLEIEPLRGGRLPEARPTLSSALRIAAPSIADDVLAAFDAGVPSEFRDGGEFASVEPPSDGSRGKVTVVRES